VTAPANEGSTVVQVSLLYFDGCPNWLVANQRLHEALTHLGRGDTTME
jgi:hypothetical protein